MPSLRMLREVTRVPQSISSGRPFRNKSEIENRYGGHARRLNIFPVPATNPDQVGPGARVLLLPFHQLRLSGVRHSGTSAVTRHGKGVSALGRA